MRTGNKEGAATDDAIYLFLYGDVCSHRAILMNIPNDFQPGQTDQFSFDRRNAGEVSYSVLMQFLCTQTWVHDRDWNTDESQLGVGVGQIDVK